ncbi:hypothetical protein PROFUN_01166 [Planoprotostelium fungivorum]|uniref:Uncharacterized protein n=1 Tax=Planoprotostelium fungivorum TaxID=1890364 RepID=A0A2P6NCH9_9EUKA|nr:hypothetical protein PROFUN_01166 [Planoprotostelium fungivorum]
MARLPFELRRDKLYKNQQKAPTVGIEPTTCNLGGYRSSS